MTRLRDELKLSEQLKELSYKQKVDHLWGYYKWHMIGTIVALIVVLTFAQALIGKEKSFDITIIDGEQARIDPFTLAANLTNHFSDFHISVDVIHSGETFSTISSDESQKMLVRAAAGNIDLLLVDDKIFQELMQQNAFAPLEDFIELETLNVANDSYYYNESNDVVYGIHTSSIQAFEPFSPLRNKVLCVFERASDVKEIERFLTVVLE
ncbi:hypothetical protein [Halalkalibacter urbisdiaboli]|uniref:hypothetical protein n=1 Tax=Halalkalibacter urbisdiaboli TaxID=1960589 RepID=UPI000B4345A9|nr:hypothetical protein [Halalkalibacter urbisdiaboli]